MTFMKGYPYEINRPDDWCDYLRWQRDHVFIEGKTVICQFQKSYVIQFAHCNTLTGAMTEAFKLAAYLAAEEPEAYPSVVTTHFLDLIRKQQKLPYFTAPMFEALWEAFDIKPRTEQEKEPDA